MYGEHVRREGVDGVGRTGGVKRSAWCKRARANGGVSGPKRCLFLGDEGGCEAAGFGRILTTGHRTRI